MRKKWIWGDREAAWSQIRSWSSMGKRGKSGKDPGGNGVVLGGLEGMAGSWAWARLGTCKWCEARKMSSGERALFALCE